MIISKIFVLRFYVFSIDLLQRLLKLMKVISSTVSFVHFHSVCCLKIPRTTWLWIHLRQLLLADVHQLCFHWNANYRRTLAGSHPEIYATTNRRIFGTSKKCESAHRHRFYSGNNISKYQILDQVWEYSIAYFFFVDMSFDDLQIVFTAHCD